MDPSPILTKIQALLDRNLFLEDSLKVRILEASEQKQQKMLSVLEQMDEKQLDILQKIIKNNPNFVGNLERVASHKELLRLMEEEAKLHQIEMEKAEKELLKKLSHIK